MKLETMGRNTSSSSSDGVAPSTSLGNANLADLLRARTCLHKGLEKSRGLEYELEKTGPRLQRLSRRIPSLQNAFAPMISHMKVIHDLGGNIDKAVGPAVAVLKVFDAIHGLEAALLTDPQYDIEGYIGLIHRLEEALSFLSENCPMAVEWLQDMVDFLEQNRVLNDSPMHRIASHLEALKAWQASGERMKLDGGLHQAALDRLETEFKRILSKESERVPLPPSTVPQEGDASKPVAAVPVQALESLQMIVERLTANGRKQRCMDLYIEIRTKVAKASLQSLQLDYLQLSYLEFGTKLDWKRLEMYIGPWTQHMEVVVKLLFEPEYQLCGQVLEKLGFEAWEECFGRIAGRGGMIEFIQFGETAARSRNEPQKLFKLLDMFEAMNNLRPSFAKVFGGPGCREVQQRTRDLLKQVVQGAHEIFLELKQQVERQRDVEPPMDGSVPRVSTFVVSYVKHLVGDFYCPIITQVLAIEQSWRDDEAGKKMEEGLLSKAVRTIMKALEQNFHEWAKCFNDPALFHLSLMNNYWYLNVNCKATELRSLVGDSWLREQLQQADLHAALYLKDGWGRATQHLNIGGVTTLTGSRAAARDLLKRRLKAFNSAFEDLYQRHSKWTIPDPELREKTCVKVVKAIVPPYRTYLQSYGPLMEQDGSQSKYAKYTAQSLERMVGSLFQGRPEKIPNASEKIINGSTAIAHPAVVSVI